MGNSEIPKKQEFFSNIEFILNNLKLNELGYFFNFR